MNTHDQTQYDIPNFKTWQRENLERFAEEAYVQLARLTEANEQLRHDLRFALQQVRAQHK